MGKPESPERLVDDAERQTRFCGVAPSDADSELIAPRCGRPFDHCGLPEARFANDEQAATSTLAGLGQQAIDRPQRAVALPDFRLLHALPSPRHPKPSVTFPPAPLNAQHFC